MDLPVAVLAPLHSRRVRTVTRIHVPIAASFFGSLVVHTQIYVSYLGADYVCVDRVVEPGVDDEDDWFFGGQLVRTLQGAR